MFDWIKNYIIIYVSNLADLDLQWLQIRIKPLEYGIKIPNSCYKTCTMF